jgi:DNA-binding NtrC family response regulator
MDATLALAARYAVLPEDILLVGPTGSGKGHLAEFIHRTSGRSGALVPVTGGQLSDTLWATQLFGHFAGAFTDAKARVLGAFELAAGGTLFLDELHHWGAAVQAALLQPLESRRYFPLGANRELLATCRMVFATTMCPDQLVADHRLLPDLRYRLPALVLSIPPLAARQGEILTLLDLFTARTISAFKWEADRFQWSASAVRALLLHPWPGNIRELLHVVKRTLAQIGPTPGRAIEHTDLELPLPPDADLTDLLAPDVMRRLVAWALARTDGARQEAADLLGVHRNTLTRYIARWGGSVPASHARAPSADRDRALDVPHAFPESA